MKTQKEIKEMQKKMDERMDSVSAARRAIIDDLKTRRIAGDKGVFPAVDTHRFYGKQIHYFCGAGEMICPICNTGKLKYSRSSYNGHVHARCTTINCVAWME